KNREPFPVDNYIRMLIMGDKDWQVPAGFEERRFAVWDVAETHMQDIPYFAAIDREMKNGGYEALLYELMNFDLSTVDLRRIPKTTALLDQKMASFTVEQNWYHDVLQRGELLGQVDEEGNCKCLKAVLHKCYIARTDQMSARSLKSTETKLGMFLSKAVGPGLKHEREKGKIENESDKRYYIFPPLKNCRTYWAALMQTTITWDDPEAKWQNEDTVL